AAGATINRLAADIRAALADHLSWVPFVDTLVVTAGKPPATTRGVGGGPGDLPHDTVGEGRAVGHARAVRGGPDPPPRGPLGGGWGGGGGGLVRVGERTDRGEPQAPTPQATSG